MSKHKNRSNLFQKKTKAPEVTADEKEKIQSNAPLLDDEGDEVEPNYDDMTFAEAYRCILNEALESGRLPDVPSHGAFVSAQASHKKLSIRNQTAHVNEFRGVAGQASAIAAVLTRTFQSLIK